MVANKPFNNIYEMKKWMWDHDELSRQENQRLERTMNIVKSVFIRGNVALKDRWVSNDGQAQGLTVLANNTEAQFNINAGMLNGTELRFWDVGSSNYVGFEAPALVANQIWVLPNADGNAAEVIGTDAAGNLGWYTASTMAGGLHDGDTLQHDAVNSNGGAFTFNTTGNLTFNSGTADVDHIINGTAANLLYCNAGDNRIGIGIATPATTTHIHAANPILKFTNATSGTTATDGFDVRLSGSDALLQHRESGKMIAYTNDISRWELSSTGNMSVGATPVADTKFYVEENTGVDRVCHFKGTDTTNKDKIIYEYIHNGTAEGQAGVRFQNNGTLNGSGVNFIFSVGGAAGSSSIVTQRLNAASLQATMKFVTRNASNTFVAKFKIDTDCHIPIDNVYLTLGAADDCGITYGGVNMEFYANLVGTGYFDFVDAGIQVNTGLADSDTKFYGTNATAVLAVDAGNNTVGINTESPTAHLHMVGDSDAALRALFSNTTQTAGAYTENFAHYLYDDSPDGYTGDVYLRVELDEPNSTGIALAVKQDGSGDILQLIDEATIVLAVKDGGNVGIGETSPSGKVHIKSGDAGAIAWSASYDDLIIENSTVCGMTLACPDPNISSINFATPSDAQAAIVSWDYTAGEFLLGSKAVNAVVKVHSGNNILAMTLDANQDVTLVQDIFSPTDKKHQFGGSLDSHYAYIEFDTAAAPDEFIIETIKNDSNLRIKNTSMNSVSAEIILETAVSTDSVVGIRFVGDDWGGTDWGDASAGNYRFLLIDENGRLRVSDTDKNISGA